MPLTTSRLTTTRRRLALGAASVAALAAAPAAAYAGTPAADGHAGHAHAEAGPSAAAQSFYTFSVGNGGKNLASNLSGSAVTAIPSASNPAQHWTREFVSGVAVPQGSSGVYRLKNRSTGLCLQDVGEGVAAAERTCHTHAITGCRQLWHNHSASDRTVNGQIFRFRFNLASGRALGQAPQFGNTVPTELVTSTGGPGSANEALKLWRTTFVGSF